jgi:hypothetical protein
LRQTRIERLAERREGGLAAQDIMHYLSDHENRPHSICGHGGEGLTTIASCVLNPGEHIIHASKGSPCAHPHDEYRVEAG